MKFSVVVRLVVRYRTGLLCSLEGVEHCPCVDEVLHEVAAARAGIHVGGLDAQKLEGSGEQVPRRASEPHDADGDAAVRAVDQRVLRDREHAHAGSLHFMHYNFGRTHKTLTKKYGKPTTPAMAAEIETRLFAGRLWRQKNRVGSRLAPLI
jgi:hypothetical protein